MVLPSLLYTLISDEEEVEELALRLLVSLFCNPKKKAAEVMGSLYEKCQVSYKYERTWTGLARSGA